MNIICTICARGGSKGVPNKNLRKVLGKPLLFYTLETALKSNIFSQIAVSSDSPAILNIVDCFPEILKLNRPADLASDSAPKLPAIRNAMLQVEQLSGQICDIIFDLDVTSPLRNIDDIQSVLDLIKQESVSNVITAMPSRRSPYFNLVERNSGRIQLCCPSAVTRRQDAPPTFDLNASIYAWKRSTLLEQNSIFLETTALYEMPLARSWDIDEELDLEIVEFLISRNNNLGTR